MAEIVKRVPSKQFVQLASRVQPTLPAFTLFAVAPVAEIVKRVPSKQLISLYKIPAFKTADELLAAVAGARGKLRKGGVPDIRAAARIILQVIAAACFVCAAQAWCALF